MTQMDMKAEFLQRELGIRAGLPSLSCRPTQKTKAGTRASEMARKAILGASRILETLAVMDLWVKLPGTPAYGVNKESSKNEPDQEPQTLSRPHERETKIASLSIWK
ncbi:hypothetical protein OEA41_003109 [Lepraria neglecta]|uniref:Uncharacterized protein n=1 Tax=Lepraria neglecta TaxID=209136 RepID=A0AAE0DJ13_9LECA|nr:hypothetical protein OEA41_003109 [Lepraria neglecta]